MVTSRSTLRQKTSWLPILLPVFYPGVDVACNDLIEIICRTPLSDDGLHPHYEIEGRLVRRAGQTIPFDLRLPHHDRVFQQNAFHRMLFPLKTSSPALEVL